MDAAAVGESALTNFRRAPRLRRSASLVLLVVIAACGGEDRVAERPPAAPVLADAAAMPTESFVAKFRDEFEAYVRGERNVAQSELMLAGAH